MSPELLLLNKKTTAAVTQEDRRKRNDKREKRKTVISIPAPSRLAYLLQTPLLGETPTDITEAGDNTVKMSSRSGK